MAIALTVAIPSTLTPIIGLVALWMNLRAGQEKVRSEVAANTKTTEATAVKMDKAEEKIIEIHTATNGNLSTLTKAHEVTIAENKGLRAVIAEMNIAKTEAKDTKDKQDVIDAVKP